MYSEQKLSRYGTNNSQAQCTAFGRDLLKRNTDATTIPICMNVSFDATPAKIYSHYLFCVASVKCSGLIYGTHYVAIIALPSKFLLIFIRFNKI